MQRTGPQEVNNELAGLKHFYGHRWIWERNSQILYISIPAKIVISVVVVARSWIVNIITMYPVGLTMVAMKSIVKYEGLIMQGFLGNTTKCRRNIHKSPISYLSLSLVVYSFWVSSSVVVFLVVHVCWFVFVQFDT